MSVTSRPSVDARSRDLAKSDLENQITAIKTEITSAAAGDDTEQRRARGLGYERNASCNICNV